MWVLSCLRYHRAMKKDSLPKASRDDAVVNPVQPVQFVEIDADLAGQRIDNFLMARLTGGPIARVYDIRRKGEERINKVRCKPDYKRMAGAVVRIPPVRITEKETGARPSNVLVKR